MGKVRVLEDKSVQSCSLHYPLPLSVRLDVIPFALCYCALGFAYFFLDTSSKDVDDVLHTGKEKASDAKMAMGQQETENFTASNLASDDITMTQFQLVLLVGLLVVTSVQGFLFLMAYWSIPFRCKLRYKSADDLEKAKVVCVIPAPHCGSAGLCELKTYESVAREDCGTGGNKFEISLPEVWFEFQKAKYVLRRDSPEGVEFTRLDYPTNLSIEAYLRSRGHAKVIEYDRAYLKWGKNEFDIPLPSLDELFLEHALSPFFLFQVFCVALWCLDEYWYYSVFTLFMLVLFELTLCKQRQKNLELLRLMRRPAYPIFVYRNSKWIQTMTDELVPGDICSIVRVKRNEPMRGGVLRASQAQTSSKEVLVPCDLLLLRGSCIVNEAMLTGESVPKMKESISSGVQDSRGLLKQELDLQTGENDSNFANHLIMGGTNVLQHSEDADSLPDDLKQLGGVYSIPRAPDRGCLAFVLRTGFSTSQGSLMRTILFSTERVSVDNAETYTFILILLVFAVIASGYVLYHGLQDERQSKWKLFLHCTMIITSVVPPELPMELSLAVTTSIARLKSLAIFCTEPYRIPIAGKLDVCCFDKTGTLTSDNPRVNGVALLEECGGNDSDLEKSEMIQLKDPSELPIESTYVLAACHQLVRIENKVDGDTMEKATVRSVKWSLGREGRMYPKNDAQRTKPREWLQVLHCYPFASALRRMSVIAKAVRIQDDRTTSTIYVLAKGAPEALQPRYAELPKDYEKAYKNLMRNGKRVLALGYKTLPDEAMSSFLMERDEAENGLRFAGFLVLDCPLKDETAESIYQLQRSNHRIVMITGDSVLTACDVARQLDITTKPPDKVLWLRTNGSKLEWISLVCGEVLDSKKHGNSELEGVRPFDFESIANLSHEFELCATGDSISWLENRSSDATHLQNVVPYITVFARVAPRQKEHILAAMCASGLHCLMCGDGTNDVGALKQADVGVSIINSPEIEKNMKRAKARIDKLAAKRKEKLSAAERLQAELMAMEEEEGGSTIVQLGDASIASPFTSRTTSIKSTVHIVRQGRCTLVTTIQMFKILALNCLISAYTLSSLYLYGVKQGDTQATLAGLLIAFLFMFISWAKPVETLAEKRPISRIFSTSVLLSLTGQFIVHMSTLFAVLRITEPYVDRNAEEMMVDADFKPNVINTAIFLLSLCMQVNVFSTNYRGLPYMESLLDNKPFHRILLATWGLSIILALEIVPDLGELFELVPMPNVEFKLALVALLVGNTIAVWTWELFIRKYVE